MQPTSRDPTAAVLPGDGELPTASRAAELGQKAADAIDSRREAIARGIESAAESIHSRAEALPGGERVSNAVHTAADQMDRAADYLRDQDVRAMLADIRHTVTRHPGAALLTAAAVGFLIARSISKN